QRDEEEEEREEKEEEEEHTEGVEPGLAAVLKELRRLNSRVAGLEAGQARRPARATVVSPPSEGSDDDGAEGLDELDELVLQPKKWLDFGQTGPVARELLVARLKVEHEELLRGSMGHEAKSLLALLGKLLKGDLEAAVFEVGTRLRELDGRARRGPRWGSEFARTMRGRKQDPDWEKAEKAANSHARGPKTLMDPARARRLLDTRLWESGTAGDQAKALVKTARQTGVNSDDPLQMAQYIAQLGRGRHHSTATRTVLTSFQLFLDSVPSPPKSLADQIAAWGAWLITVRQVSGSTVGRYVGLLQAHLESKGVPVQQRRLPWLQRLLTGARRMAVALPVKRGVAASKEAVMRAVAAEAEKDLPTAAAQALMWTLADLTVSRRGPSPTILVDIWREKSRQADKGRYGLVAAPLSLIVLRHLDGISGPNSLLFPDLEYHQVLSAAKRTLGKSYSTKSFRRGAATALRETMSEDDAMAVTGHRKKSVFRYYVEGPAVDTLKTLESAQRVLQGASRD
ncbi:hypothetical protein DIPPA_26518, partial [Diplonema papillatum]